MTIVRPIHDPIFHVSRGEQDVAASSRQSAAAADQANGEKAGITVQDVSAGVVAVFTVVLTLVGVGQLAAIRRQADIANRALIAAERAYLFPGVIDCDGVVDQTGRMVRWSFKARWKNSGSTPARYVDMQTSYVVTSMSGLDKSFNFEDGPKGDLDDGSLGSVGPGVEVLGESTLIAPDVLKGAWQKQTRVFIYGWAEYEDIFPGTSRRRTEFCFEARPQTDPTRGSESNPFRLTNFSSHNGSDDECRRQPGPKLGKT